MTLDSLDIGVVGAGTMGQGIAQVCAVAGYRVLLYDVQPELIKNAIISIRKSLDNAVVKAKITPIEKENALNRITPITDFRLLQVDLIIEAVIEKLEVKQKIFSELEKLNTRDCILTSNTSSISITQIGSALKHQDRFAGLHFFNPAYAMKLIEIISGSASTKTTIDFLLAFTKKIGRIPVLAKDSPGFIVNRVARLFYTEPLKIAEESITDFKSIDRLMSTCGFKMGPFELIDLIGMDVNLAVTKSIYEGFNYDSKFRPSRIQQQKVDAGFLGIKSGKGFYDYSK